MGTLPAMENPEAETTFHLLERVRAGDDGALDTLLGRYLPRLQRWARGRLPRWARDVTDTDDLVQETFIRAFRRVDTFRGQCQFRTWLLTIGGNALKDAGRRAQRTRVVPLSEGLRAPGGDPYEVTVAGEMERRLRDGLAKLPRMQREVFLLRAQQGMEYDDIAAALSTSSGAARVHYHHAVKRLKEFME